MVTTRLPRGFNVGPRDIQVLTPQHGAEVGTKALNKRLQDALNPPGPPQVSRGDTVFRQGDKVTQTANDYERDVFNGDVGYIAEVNTEEKILTVDFDGRLVECAGKDLDSLRLAYASTIHRCVHPSTIVETSNGLQPIRSIAPSGLIATPHGPRAYTDLFSLDNQALVKIDTTDGYNLTCTTDHGWMCGTASVTSGARPARCAQVNSCGSVLG